jgi:hypothetical protein
MFKLIVLPIKLLLLPFVAVIALMKVTVILALGVALAGVFLAVLIPLLVLGSVVALPFALLAAAT